jgi:hypothetical protein
MTVGTPYRFSKYYNRCNTVCVIQQQLVLRQHGVNNGSASVEVCNAWSPEQHTTRSVSCCLQVGGCCSGVHALQMTASGLRLKSF